MLSVGLAGIRTVFPLNTKSTKSMESRVPRMSPKSALQSTIASVDQLLCVTGLNLLRTFSKISQFLEKILTEHIHIKKSVKSKLQNDIKNSIRTLSRNKKYFAKTHVANFQITKMILVALCVILLTELVGGLISTMITRPFIPSLWNLFGGYSNNSTQRALSITGKK